MLQIFLMALPLFALIGVGSVCKLLFADDDWVEVLNVYGLYVGVPALIFTGLSQLGAEEAIDLELILYNLGIITLIVVATFALARLFRLDVSIVNTYAVCVFFGNVGYMGLPFVLSIAPAALGDASMVLCAYIFALSTVGIVVLEFSSGRGFRNLPRILLNTARNPLLLAVVAAVGLAYFDLRLPAWARSSVEMLAASASPVVLVALGVFIVRKIELSVETVHALVITGAKLVVMPLVFAGSALLLGLGDVLEISVIQAAMPLALTPFALAQLYPMNRNVVALVVIFSTALSLVTLPAWVSGVDRAGEWRLAAAAAPPVGCGVPREGVEPPPAPPDGAVVAAAPRTGADAGGLPDVLEEWRSDVDSLLALCAAVAPRPATGPAPEDRGRGGPG